MQSPTNSGHALQPRSWPAETQCPVAVQLNGSSEPGGEQSTPQAFPAHFDATTSVDSSFIDGFEGALEEQPAITSVVSTAKKADP